MPRSELSPARRPGDALPLIAALAVTAALGALLECAAPQPPRAPLSNTASAPAGRATELDELVAAVLARLPEEDGIPDAGLLPQAGPVYVLTEVEYKEAAGAAEDAAADAADHRPAGRIRTLPAGPRAFVGKTMAELEAEADRTGDRVVFVHFYGVTRKGDTAFVSVGADVALPGHAPKLCCCLAEDRYDRRAGRWTFTARGSQICS